MGDGLHDALVHAEGVLDELLAVAGAGAAADGHPAAAAAVELFQLPAHQLHGIALVGAIIAIENFPILGDQGELGGGGAAVNAKPGLARIAGKIPGLHRSSGMAGAEGLVLRLIGKEGLEPLPGEVERGAVPAQCLPEGLIGIGAAAVPAIERCAHGHGKAAVLGEDRRLVVQLERLAEALAKTLAEVERAAQEHHLGLNLPPLGKAGDGLVDHGLVNGRRHVGLAGALV